jgi:transposase-like protein
MPRRYPAEIRRQVVELARAGTRVAQLSATFGMTETTIYNWIKQDKIDHRELAVARKVNEIFLDQDLAPKASSR